LRKTLILLWAVLLAFAIVSAFGCGGGGDTGEATEEKVTLQQQDEAGKGGKVTVEGGEGEKTYEVGEERIPSEEELGAPIYPGAEYVPGSGVPAKISTESGETTLIKAEFRTSKSPSKVIEWYKTKLGDPPVSEEEETYWVYANEAGDRIIVKIRQEGKGSIIYIGKASGELNLIQEEGQ